MLQITKFSYWLKGIVSICLACAFTVVNLYTVSPSPVSASSRFDLPNRSELNTLLSESEKEILEKAQQFSSVAADEAQKIAKVTLEESSGLVKLTVKDAQKMSKLTHDAAKASVGFLVKLLTDKKLVASAQHFSTASSDTFCRAYFDAVQGSDQSRWTAFLKGADATLKIAGAIQNASIAGAGSLTGYAGLASVVSQLGLGSFITTLAGLMGSNAVGAAATSVVTAAVGGPVVMGALIAGGAVVGEYGVYKLGQFSVSRFNDWAGGYCSLSASLP